MLLDSGQITCINAQYFNKNVIGLMLPRLSLKTCTLQRATGDKVRSLNVQVYLLIQIGSGERMWSQS